jgi:hypothetical protein
MDRVASSSPRSSKKGMLVNENRPKEFMALIWSFMGMAVDGEIELCMLSDLTDPLWKEPIEPELQ